VNNIVVGKTTISYSIRESNKASNMTINVSPESVVVVTPAGLSPDLVQKYIQEKAHWIYTKQDLLKEQAHKMNEAMPIHFRSGSKILYRDRRVMLHIQKEKVDSISIKYLNGFYITVPEELHEATWDGTLYLEITSWMKQQVFKDANQFCRKYSRRLNLYPKDLRVKEQKHLWGSLGKDKIININWMLAYAPRLVLEYVVAHEVCHLKYRNHSNEFWYLLGSVFSQWESCRDWLEGWKV